MSNKNVRGIGWQVKDCVVTNMLTGGKQRVVRCFGAGQTPYTQASALD